MFQDNHLEYKMGTLTIKNQTPDASKNIKPKQTTKLDFSDGNYEKCTLGHSASMNVAKENPKLYERICEKVKEVVLQKSANDTDTDDNDNCISFKADPEYLACALLFSKKKICSNGDDSGSGNDSDDSNGTGNGNNSNNSNDNHGTSNANNDNSNATSNANGNGNDDGNNNGSDSNNDDGDNNGNCNNDNGNNNGNCNDDNGDSEYSW